MGLFYRLFQHLLPDAIAWRPKDAASEILVGEDHAVGDPGLSVGSLFGRYALWQLISGLCGAPEDARDAIDGLFSAAFPSTTLELAEWERQFGVPSTGTESQRRQQLDAAWRAQGGQSPRYLQDTVRAAGFDVYIHESWNPDLPPFQQIQCGEPLAQCGEPRAQCSAHSFRRFWRDPHSFTEYPLVGTVQCGEPLAQCGEPLAQCNAFMANEPGYLVNADLTRNPPPIIPTDDTKYPFFIYWGAASFPDRATVPASRRAEFERLLLKLRPTDKWLVTLVDYV